MGKIKKYIFFIILCLLFIAYNKKPKENEAKIIIIGIDGATWSVITPLLEKGLLPNIQKLMNEGIYGELSTLTPTVSPAIWTSIATGKSPDKHGITDFLFVTPEYEEVLVTSHRKKTKAIWNICSDYNKSVGIIDWMETWPAEKVKGFMISDNCFYGAIKSSFSPGLHEKLPEVFYKGINKLICFKKETNWLFEEDLVSVNLNELKFNEMKDALILQTGLYLLRKNKPNLFMIYFKGLDTVEHRFWRYMDLGNEKLPDGSYNSNNKIQKNAIKNYYILMDNIIGKLFSLANENTIFFVISDHGHEREEHIMFWPVYINRVLEQLIFFKFKENTNEVDWSHTQAFFAGSFPSSFEQRLYINLKERYPYGIVTNANYEKVKTDLINKLSDITFIPSRKHVFLLDKCEYANDKCDLKVKIVPFSPPGEAILINGCIHPYKSFFVKRENSGGHSNAPPGIIIIKGKNILKNKKVENASVLDIAPTILYILDIPIGRDMDGKLLTQVFDYNILINKKVKYIDSHDRGIRDKKDNEMAASEADDMIKEELRSLGYIQ